MVEQERSYAKKGVAQMKKQKLWRSWFVILIIVVLGVVLSLFMPWSAFGLSSHPHPAQSYDEAAQRVAVLRAGQASDMNPDCLTQFMTHGQKVQHVIVMVHGYTNCPAQFLQLGQRFYDLGGIGA